MRNLLKKITKYPVSTLITLVIWILCFMPIPETPLSEISLIDKWTHIAMYVFLCAALWAEYLRCHSVSAANSVSNGSKATTKIKTNEAKDKQPARWSTAFLLTFILPVVMGGLIEILPGKLYGRSPKRRLARLACRFHRRSTRRYYRYSSGMVSFHEEKGLLSM